MALPPLPELALFMALVLVLSLYGLTVSGHFPEEHRDASLRAGVGPLLLWGTMALCAALAAGSPGVRLAAVAALCGGDRRRDHGAVRAAAAATVPRQLRQWTAGIADIRRTGRRHRAGRRKARCLGRKTHDGGRQTCGEEAREAHHHGDPRVQEDRREDGLHVGARLHGGAMGGDGRRRCRGRRRQPGHDRARPQEYDPRHHGHDGDARAGHPPRRAQYVRPRLHAVSELQHGRPRAA